MVGPPSGSRRRTLVRRVKIGFVLLVGASAGLITLQGDPAPAVVGGAFVAGTGVGVVLVRLVFPGTGEVSTLRSRNR